jgi:hypothetical protein
MLLNIGDKKYAVHFAHRCGFDVDSDIPIAVQGHWATYCGIHEGACVIKGCADYAHPYQGVAHCHSHDQFSKYVGRKVALGRALKAFPRPLRKHIWHEYFKQSPIR